MIDMDDSWNIRPGSEFTNSEDYATRTRHVIKNSTLVLPMMFIIDALELAAEPDGSLIDLDFEKFVQIHLDKACDGISPVTSNSFTHGVVMEALLWLVHEGVLAHRGNGDSVDYHLAMKTLEG